MGVVVVDARDRTLPVIHVDDGFERITGHAREDVVGRSCRMLVSQSSDPGQLELLRRSVRAKASVTVTLAVVRRDGERRATRLTVLPVRDATGHITELHGHLLDVTAYTAALAAAEAAERRLTDTLAALHEPVFLVGPDGSHPLNDRLTEMLGVDPLKLPHEERWRLITKEDGTPFSPAATAGQQAIATGEPLRDVLVRVHPRDRAPRWGLVNARPVVLDGEPRAVVSLVDVTERIALGREHAALGRLATAIARGADEAEVVAIAGEQARTLCEADASWVIRHRAPGRFEVVASHGDAPLPLGEHHDPDGTLAGVLRRPGPTVVDLAPREHPLGLRAWAAVPIRVEGRAWGILGAGLRRPRERDDPFGTRISRLAELLAAAVADQEVRARLRTQATSDALTGLGNHRRFHERLREEAARARRRDRPLTVALLDLDGFKAINDALGHAAGDQVLVEVARRLRATLRDEDVICRVGGDEFGLVLVETEALEAHAIVDRVRQSVERRRFIADAQLSLSAGLCDLQTACEPGRMVELADAALYHAKASGRNVTWRYDERVISDLTADERAARLRRTRALEGFRALAQAVDARDGQSGDHSAQVAVLAERLALVRGWPVERAARLHEAALLHDIGKVALPEDLLRKAAPLADAEAEAVRSHVALSAQMLDGVLDVEQVSWVRCHHERWDGLGYPAGLRGEAIPEGALLLAVAEAFDAMTRPRRFAAVRDHAGAVAEVAQEAGAQFAPWAPALLTETLDVGGDAVAR